MWHQMRIKLIIVCPGTLEAEDQTQQSRFLDQEVAKPYMYGAKLANGVLGVNKEKILTLNYLNFENELILFVCLLIIRKKNLFKISKER